MAKAKARPATFGQGQSTPSVAVTHCRISRVLSEIIASRAFHNNTSSNAETGPCFGTPKPGPHFVPKTVESNEASKIQSFIRFRKNRDHFGDRFPGPQNVTFCSVFLCFFADFLGLCFCPRVSTTNIMTCMGCVIARLVLLQVTCRCVASLTSCGIRLLPR